MESWQFIQSPAGDWYWLCSNVISRQTRESTATFKTRMECVANAMAAGYQKMVSGAGNGNAPARQQHKQPHKPQQPRQAPPAGGQPAAKRAQRRNRSKSKRNTKSN